MHKMTAFILVLAVIATTIPLVHAQSDGSQATVQVDDPSGDAVSQPAPIPSPGFVDLTRGVVSVNDTALTFEATIADASLDAVTGYPIQSRFWVDFEYRSTTFRFVWHLGDDRLAAAGIGGLLDEPVLYRLKDDSWTNIANGQALQTSGTTPSAALELAAIRDEADFFPGPGETIHPVNLASFYQSQPVYNPNQGSANVPLPTFTDSASFSATDLLAIPGLQSGMIRLATPQPIKYSNGGGTFNWPVEVTNLAKDQRTFALEMKVPSGVQARVPSEVTVDAGQSSIVQAYAYLSFGHEHGGTLEMELKATTSEDDVVLPLSVHFLDTPQPAGHHSTVYLHGPAGGGLTASQTTDPELAWMNTLSEDPAGTATQLDPGFSLCNGVQSLRWWIPLQPALVIGLDAKIEQKAKLHLQLTNPLPTQGAEISAMLGLYDPRTDSRLPAEENWPSELLGTATMPAATTETTTTLDLEIPLGSEMDFYTPDSRALNLGLVVRACGAGSDATFSLPFPQIRIQTGSSLELPLNEFQQLPEVSASQSSVRLSSNQGIVPTRPGANTTFEVQATATQEGTFRITLFGNGQQYAAIVGDDEVRLDSEATTVRIQLGPPMDAVTGQVFQVFVILEDAKDPFNTASIPLGVVADPSAALSQGSPSTAAKESPSIGWLTAGTAMLVLALVRRRQ